MIKVKNQFILPISVFFYILMIGACKMHAVPAKPEVNIKCNEPKPTYNGEIKAILDANCASTCHSEKNNADGINLSTYENVKAISQKNRFLGSIRHQEGYEPMPRKKPKLADEDILKIACWIEGGSMQ